MLFAYLPSKIQIDLVLQLDSINIDV